MPELVVVQKMKHLLSLLGYLALSTGMQAQLLRYSFNEGNGNTSGNSSSTTNSLSLLDSGGNLNDSLWSIAGGGPSASLNDHALNLTIATGMGTGHSGPFAKREALEDLPDLTKFTITGWFRPTVTDLSRTSLVMVKKENKYLLLQGLSGGPVGARSRLNLRISNEAGLLIVNSAGEFEEDLSTPFLWAFFAVTYDSTALINNVKFYTGNQGSSVSISSTLSASSEIMPLSGSSLWIGNSSNGGSPFQGYMDEIHIYDSILTLVEIEAIRTSSLPKDLKPQAITCRPDATKGFVLEWIGAQTTGFTVQYNANLTGTWNTAAADPTLVGPNKWSYNDSLWKERTQCFYRIAHIIPSIADPAE